MKNKGEETLLGVLLNIWNVTIETIEIVTLQKHLVDISWQQHRTI